MSLDDGRRLLTNADPMLVAELTQPFSLIGETIEYSPFNLLQRPNPAIIQILAAADERIKYVPADPMLIASTAPHTAFSDCYDEVLSAQLRKDFPDEYAQLRMRGITASIRDEFLCFPSTGYWKGEQPERTDKVDNVLTILKKGNGGDRHRSFKWFSTEMSYGKISYVSGGAMHNYTTYATSDLRFRGETTHAENLFPALIVYKGYNTDAWWDNTPPEKRIAAIYLTDRFINSSPFRKAPSGNR